MKALQKVQDLESLIYEEHKTQNQLLTGVLQHLTFDKTCSEV